ncbi:hypothetical protein [Marinobacter halodurans]|uniref:hypothetical protein n=1 Tax=Marinobacter halodurans TaxID=2528979 RepID=UPI0013F16C3F|nr:hypothetical protein [Marinobacter halodurans]
MAVQIAHTLKVWQRRAASRRAMRQHILWSDVSVIERDLGMAPGSLNREAHKPFWVE